jgi:hypothetical protein
MFMAFFGGEGGITTDRVHGHQPARRQLQQPLAGLLPDASAWAVHRWRR